MEEIADGEQAVLVAIKLSQISKTLCSNEFKNDIRRKLAI